VARFRGARFDPGRFRASLEAVAPLVAPWEGTTILTIRNEQVRDLFVLFDAVREVKPTQPKWVVTSKALHHLLPDLILPMDNQLTAPFLGRPSLPATFDQAFLVESYVAFIGVVRDSAFGIGSRRTRAAASQVPYPVADASPRDCGIGLARVVDFAIAGYVLRFGQSTLRSL
jgi:hypothetical protein